MIKLILIIIVISALFGFSLTVLFWIYTIKQDDSISEHEDDNEYIYELWIDEDDARVN